MEDNRNPKQLLYGLVRSTDKRKIAKTKLHCLYQTQVGKDLAKFDLQPMTEPRKWSQLALDAGLWRSWVSTHAERIHKEWLEAPRNSNSPSTDGDSEGSSPPATG
jgi:hypothetical protein